MASPSPQILRPQPRRPFDTNRVNPKNPPSPLLAPSSPDETPSRTHSILNLTSSTLFGIYSSTGYQDDREELSTPWGTGAETPVDGPLPRSLPSNLFRRKSPIQQPAISTTILILSLAFRTVLLFGMGMLYGLLVKHLHDDRQLASFQVEGIIKPRNDWGYLIFWGVSGVALGSLMPWVDLLWEDSKRTSDSEKRRRKISGEEEKEIDSTRLFGGDWTPVIRSVGAFVGIAFAIRKLPWTSTLQVSLTLFLVNPVLWYIIDRSTAGFLLSSFVGATGTTLLLLSNPDMMPSPTSSLRNSTLQDASTTGSNSPSAGMRFNAYISTESLEGGIWILSVLFCSCVCFGNVGRRLALRGGRDRKDSRK